MSGWTIAFLIVAIVAALFGFTGTAGVKVTIEIAWIVFMVGLILFIVFLFLDRASHLKK